MRGKQVSSLDRLSSTSVGHFDLYEHFPVLKFPRMDFDMPRTFAHRRVRHFPAAMRKDNAGKAVCRITHKHDVVVCILHSDIVL